MLQFGSLVELARSSVPYLDENQAEVCFWHKADIGAGAEHVCS